MLVEVPTGNATVTLDENGNVRSVSIPGCEPPELVETIPSQPIKPFLPIEFQEGMALWRANGG